MTFTWCSGHCGITGNKLADVQAKKGADADQTDVDHHYTTAKAMIRRATRGGPASLELTQRIYGDRGFKVNRKEEGQLGRRDQAAFELVTIRNSNIVWQKSTEQLIPSVGYVA